MKNEISSLEVVDQLSFVSFYPSPVCTKLATGWHSASQKSKAGKQVLTICSIFFFFVCTVQFKGILHSLHVTLPSLKVCIKPGGHDAVISVALFCWRKSSKDEKHQREQQGDRDCEEWLIGHVCWCFISHANAISWRKSNRRITTPSGFCFSLWREFSENLSWERGPEISIFYHIR